MEKLDSYELAWLMFFSVLAIVALCVMGGLFYASMTTPRVRFGSFTPPPPPPAKRKETEPYSFLNVCSYNQLRVLADLFPPQKPIMLEDVGDLFVFKKAVDRQIQIVRQHIKDFKNESGTDVDG